MHKQLCNVAKLVKTINIYINLAILAPKQFIKLMLTYLPHLFAKYYKYYL